MSYDKLVVITRKTRLEELILRFNTKGQARFYIEHSGGDFSDYEKEHRSYAGCLEVLHHQLQPLGMKVQFVDRQFLPNFIFSQHDLILVVGQDGLVANTAKYAGAQPIIGINPDPGRFDGILVPVKIMQVRSLIESVQDGKSGIKAVTLAEATLNDGQKLLAFNDLFIGARSHVSARYRLQLGNVSESQSSSGIIVSTGAGSTGWLSSVFNMVSAVNSFMGLPSKPGTRFGWDAHQLMFVVREPFVSKHSTARVVAGVLEAGESLTIESRMPSGGTIFSDGIENDFLAFDSGLIASIGVAPQRAMLVVPPAPAARPAPQARLDSFSPHLTRSS